MSSFSTTKFTNATLLAGCKPINPCDKISFRKPPFQRNPKLRWSFGTNERPCMGGVERLLLVVSKSVLKRSWILDFWEHWGTMIVHTLLVPLQGLAFLCHNISMKCWVSNADQVGILGENWAVESGKKAISCLQMQWRNPLDIVDMFFGGAWKWVNYLQVHNPWNDVILRICS